MKKAIYYLLLVVIVVITMIAIGFLSTFFPELEAYAPPFIAGCSVGIIYNKKKIFNLFDRINCRINIR